MMVVKYSVVLAALGTVGLAGGASIEITNPDSTNSYHAGDAVPVKWFYEGDGENFSIFLLKSGEQVADLCAAEEDGICFDLTQDQTVLLPESGLESGADYTIRVKDQSSDAEHVSESFTILGSSETNIEVTFPDGSTTLSAGAQVDVSWLYVGNNELFDIYLRQNGLRVSENLCGSESDGSCRSSHPRSATVTLPSEIADATDYRLLVVDKKDDDAWGLSNGLSVGVSLSTNDSSFTAEWKLGLTIGLCAVGVCLIAICMACCCKVRKNRRVEEQRTMDMLGKRRAAPAVSLAVEGIQQPDSPDQKSRKGSKSDAFGRFSWCVPTRLRARRTGRKVVARSNSSAEGESNSPSPNKRTDHPSSPEDNC